jgi:C4-dicarboxylate-specific signal transduction histidine kinase
MDTSIIVSFDPPGQTIITRLAVVIGLLFVVAYISDLTSKILNKNKQALHEHNLQLVAKTKLLEKAEAELRESQKELETRIEERTIKLRETNEQLKADIAK